MTLKENLDSILNIKNNIKSALQKLGISLTGKTFKDYPAVISSLDLEKHNVTTASKTITQNGTTSIIAADNNVYNKVDIITNVKPNLQSKSCTPSTLSQEIKADTNYDGLSSVKVDAIKTEELTISPNELIQTFTPSSGKFINKVTCNKIETSAVSNIYLSNTKDIITPENGKYLSSVTVDINVPDYPNTRNSLQKKGICTVLNNDSTMNNQINNLPSVAILKDTTINNKDCYTLNENKDSSYFLYKDLMDLGGDMSSIFINNKENKPIFALNAGGKYINILPCYYIKEISSRNPLWLINSCNAFYNMQNLKSIPIIDLTGNYAPRYMFYNCRNLKEINFTGRASGISYETSEYYEAGFSGSTACYSMFYNCYELEKITGFDITNLLTNDGMWENCTKLKHLTFDGTETIRGDIYAATYSRVMTYHDLYETLHSLPTAPSAASPTNFYINQYTITDSDGNYINDWTLKRKTRFESEATYYNYKVQYVTH